MSGARIGLVKFKAGGAQLVVLRNEQRDAGGKENWRGLIVKHAKSIADCDKPESYLVGFFVMGLFSDGSYNVGFRWDDKRSPIPRTLMPAYIEEVIRRDFISRTDAAEIAREEAQ